jgi:hypothetical protein
MKELIEPFPQKKKGGRCNKRKSNESNHKKRMFPV